MRYPNVTFFYSLRHRIRTTYHLPPYYLSGNVISAAVGFVYINLQPEYELPSSTRLGQFQKFGKTGVGGTVPQPALKKILHGNSVLVHSYLCVRFDLPSSITFRDINGVPKFRAQDPY